ncbi:unnamed protein product [Parajaminaea phylloscopi]
MLRRSIALQRQSAAARTLQGSSRLPLVARTPVRGATAPSAQTFATCPRLSAALRSSSRRCAESTTPQSSIGDPAEREAQKLLEEGTAKLETGDFEGAKESYLKSLSVLPTASTHFNLGVVYFRLSNLPEAMKSFETCLKLSPDSADAHTNLASCYVMSSPSRPDLAVEHLQKATALDNQDGESWFNLGAVLEACERLEEALKAYERSKDLGIERADENKRNVVAKILAAKLANANKDSDKSAEESKGTDSA